MLKYESTSGYAMLQVSGSGLEVLTDVAILINQVYRCRNSTSRR